MSLRSNSQREKSLFIWMGAPVLAAVAVLGFVGYRVLANLGRRWRRGAAVPVTPRTLLLLRVFGFDRRTQGFLDEFGQRWRYLGPVRLIAGPDAAYSTVEPHEFFDFLALRLSRTFIKGTEDLESRLNESLVTPDPDGLFRVQDFFCHQDTWQMTVSHLARDADAVLMDLRGFGPARRGCIYEIEQLIGLVPLPQIVLLVDGTTDVAFLDSTVRSAWRSMPDSSPNAGHGAHRLRVLQTSSRRGGTVDTIIGLLCAPFGDVAPGALPRATVPSGEAGRDLPMV
jgi:hypothetical protein